MHAPSDQASASTVADRGCVKDFDRSPLAERSHLVDQVYAHSLQSGMASIAERVNAQALGEQPKLRVVSSEKSAGR